MKTFLRIFSAAVVFAASQAAGAFSPSECSGAIQKLNSFSATSQEDAIRFALSLDQDSWSKLQQAASGGLNIPVDGVPIGVNANWSDAKEVQSKLRQRYALDQSSGSRGVWASQRIDQAAYPAYRDCLLSSAVGIHVILQKVEGNSIRGTWVFGTSSGDPTVRTVRIRHSSNARAATDSPLVWRDQTGSVHNDFTIERIGSGDVNVTAEVTGEGVTKQTATLDPIVEPQQLRAAIFQTVTLTQETEFNAFYNRTTGVKLLQFTPTHQDGQIISASSSITRYETTVSVVGLETVEGSVSAGLPSNGTVTVPVGCRGYTYTDGSAQVSNCSGHGVATAVERYVAGWRPFP